MGLTFYFHRLHLEIALGWLYVKIKVNVAKKRR